MNRRLGPIPETNEDIETCDHCPVLEEEVVALKKRIHFLEKIIFYGKYNDFIYDSLNASIALVNIISITGQRYTIRVNVRTTVYRLKKSIEVQHGFEWHRITLIFNGQKTENHRSLLGLSIPADASLHMVVTQDPFHFPPFDALTKHQRKEVAKDEYLYREHSLKRNQHFKNDLSNRKRQYIQEKKTHREQFIQQTKNHPIIPLDLEPSAAAQN